MEKHYIKRYSLPPLVGDYKAVLDDVEKILIFNKVSRKESIMIVAMELISNAVKYGDVIPNLADSNIDIGFEISKDKVLLTVSNYVANSQNIKSFTEHYDKIKKSGKPASFLKKRMKEILETNNVNDCRMGLCRVASHNKFNVHYTYKNKKLTITAVNEIKKSR